MTTPSVQSRILSAWIKKIEDKMEAEATASVEIEPKEDELSWIRTTLIPALGDHGMTGWLRRYNKPGDTTGCDCWSEICDHSSGRKLVVTLK